MLLYCRKLTDFDVMEAEVQDCRRHWLDVCEEAVNERQKSLESLICYTYSAVLVGENDPGFSHSKQYMDILVCYFGTTGQVYVHMYTVCRYVCTMHMYMYIVTMTM